jgi:hypothetical protein
MDNAELVDYMIKRRSESFCEDRDEVEVVIGRLLTEKSTESKMKFFVWKFLLYWTITYFRQLF